MSMRVTVSVAGMAAVELPFFRAAWLVLCFAFVSNKSVDNTPVFQLLLNSACAASRLSRSPLPPMSVGIWQEIGRWWSQDGWCTLTQVIQSHTTSCSAIESHRKEGGMNVRSYGVYLSKQLLESLRPCFLEMAKHLLCWWEVMNELFCFPCARSFCFPY